jgi:ornithine cyclodeaminase
MTILLTPLETAAILPWLELVNELALVALDDSVQVPARLVQPLGQGANLLIMPALDRNTAITKLITHTPANTDKGRPTIQGDVSIFDIATGQRLKILDGPTVTARRTAAVSALAARELASQPKGPLLILGAGVQGKAHIEAFAAVLGTQQVMIASRSQASAQALVTHAQSLGLKASVVQDANAALADCALTVTCTPASSVVLSSLPRVDGFISAVGAFTPKMIELSAGLCQHFANHGRVVVDTTDALHEAGDLLQAGLDPSAYPNLANILREEKHLNRTGCVLFKSCGWAGWDLAAARLALKV